MRTRNLDLVMENVIRVVVYMIGYKRFQIVPRFKLLEKKIKMRLQRKSVYYIFH